MHVSLQVFGFILFVFQIFEFIDVDLIMPLSILLSGTGAIFLASYGLLTGHRVFSFYRKQGSFWNPCAPKPPGNVGANACSMAIWSCCRID